MNNLGDFLQRFKKILASKGIEKSLIVEVFKNDLGVEVAAADVQVKNNILYVSSTSPALKNTIFLKKKTLLENINKSAGSKLTDIR